MTLSADPVPRQILTTKLRLRDKHAAELKTCTKCQEPKPESDFNIRRDTALREPRLRSWCKSCEKDKHRQWQTANKVRRSTQRRAANISDPIRTMLASARRRAERDGREFSITAADISLPEHCPILGIPIERREGRHPGSPSLDRIDARGGYTPNNVLVISWRANSLKSDGNIAEFENILAFMRERLGSVHDRDVNAARNIRRVGLDTLRLGAPS